MKFTDHRGNPIKIGFWKQMLIGIHMAAYSVWYFKRNRITAGRLGNRIEIHKSASGDSHKVRVSEHLKTIKI